ncbi:hypothetical protein TNCV_2106951 [Trichonephila clavipes]|nr:hypothetical protein TNCV_2106951 [Trichonephila clavipes]
MEDNPYPECRRQPCGELQKRSERKPPISALNGPTGIVSVIQIKTEVIAQSLESQFQLNDIHNPHKKTRSSPVVDAYLDSNANNIDLIPPLSHLK